MLCTPSHSGGIQPISPLARDCVLRLAEPRPSPRRSAAVSQTSRSASTHLNRLGFSNHLSPFTRCDWCFAHRRTPAESNPSHPSPATASCGSQSRAPLRDGVRLYRSPAAAHRHTRTDRVFPTIFRRLPAATGALHTVALRRNPTHLTPRPRLRPAARRAALLSFADPGPATRSKAEFAKNPEFISNNISEVLRCTLAVPGRTNWTHSSARALRRVTIPGPFQTWSDCADCSR